MQVPAPVEYERATSVDHALALLERHGPEARLLAGRSQPAPDDEAAPCPSRRLIDINDLADLAYIRVEDDELRIGAMTRHRELLDSAVAGEHFSILRDAERVIADPIVRNRGTVGGSICQADPVRGPLRGVRRAAGAGRDPVVLGHAGRRRWTTSTSVPYATAVGPAEILVEVRIPIRPGSGSAYEKVERRAGDWAVVAAGAFLASRRRPDRRRGHRSGRGGRRALPGCGGRGVPAGQTRRTRPTSPRPARLAARGVQPRGRPTRSGRLQAASGQ